VGFGSRLRFLAIPVALIVAAVAVRNAAVHALADSDPAAASAFWAGHPDVQTGQAMIAIGKAAASGAPVPQEVFARLGEVAGKAPLAPESFVVAGIRADIEGDEQTAELAFLAARARDPRSIPARYFLAQHYLRANDVRGLQQVADLTRLSPGGADSIAPYLAEFAKQQAAQAPMRRIFADNPELRNAVLTTLASNAANAPLVLRLGGIGQAEDKPWIATLLRSLVDAGEFSQAKLVWVRAAGLPPTAGLGLYDSNFDEPKAPPPFNWELVSSSTGLAERSNHRLHVIYYGERDGILARQLIVLGPGLYRLVAPASSGANDDRLWWSVRCAKGTTGEPLSAASVKHGQLDFAVGGDCPAVWLELSARSSDIGGNSDVNIGPAKLAKVAAP